MALVHHLITEQVGEVVSSKEIKMWSIKGVFAVFHDDQRANFKVTLVVR